MKSAGKIWGTTTQIESNHSFEFHRIEFKANFECSQHKHETKSNGFFVESGQLLINVWPKDGPLGSYGSPDVTILNPGDYMSVPPGQYHQFVGLKDGVAFEVYWSAFDPDDIVRRTTGQRVPTSEVPLSPQQDLNWDGQ